MKFKVTAITLDIEQTLINEYKNTRSERSANELVRTYRKFVFSIALRYVENYDDADDISQEVFIKVLQTINKFEGKSSFRTWLYRITVNYSINHLRKKKFRNLFRNNDSVEQDDFVSNSTSPDKEFENKEFEKLFLQTLSKLPEKQRETFALRYFDELPYDEIAQLLGTSIGGLKANYHLAVKKIASIIKSSQLFEIKYEN